MPHVTVVDVVPQDDTDARFRRYFKNSGIQNAFAIQMIMSAINVLSTIPGLWAIDKIGRRPLLFWGAVGMAVSQLIVACTGLTNSQAPDGAIIVNNLSAQKAGIAFVCIYIFFFASTWGPLAWVVTGEIFPLKHRARGLSMTTATNVGPFPRGGVAARLCWSRDTDIPL